MRLEVFKLIAIHPLETGGLLATKIIKGLPKGYARSQEASETLRLKAEETAREDAEQI